MPIRARFLTGGTALALVLAATVPASDAFAKTKTSAAQKPAAVQPAVPPAAPQDPLIAAADAAAKSGDKDATRKANDAISQARAGLPAWVAEKQQAASAVPADKQRVLGMWSKLRQASLTADAAGDEAKALDTASRALSVAHDNLGDGHFATILSGSDTAALDAKAGKIEDAETTYQAAIQAAEGSLGAGHPETLKIRAGLTDLYLHQLRFVDALASAQAAAQAAAKDLGADHPLTLGAWVTVARTKIADGQSKAAAADLDGLCARSRKVFGDWHPDVARCLAASQSAETAAGDVDKAVATAGEAARIWTANGMESDPAALALRIDLGGLMQRQGQLAEAKTVLESTVADAKTAKDHASEMSADAALVEVLDDLGEDDAAETLGTQVLDDRTKTLGPGHPDRLAALTALAGVHRKQGRLVEAENGFHEAYAQYTRVLGPKHPATIISANNLGEILEKEGVFDQAEPFLRQAVDSSREAYGETHPTTLAAYNNLALLFESQGVFDKAEPLYKTVISIEAKAGGPRNPDTIAATNNLAYLYMLQGDYPKAADMFAQVLAAWEKAYGSKHINTMKALNNLARAHHRMGKVADAEKEFDRALATRRKVLGDKHMDTLRSQHDLAALYASTNRLDQAKDLLVKTLAGDEETLGAQHPYTFETANTLAGVLTAKGDKDGALKLRQEIFKRRNAFLDRMLYVTGSNAREGYIRLYAPELAAYVAQLSAMGGDAGAKAVEEVSLARKGLLLKVASELQQVTRLSHDPEMARIAQELTQSRKRLAALTLAGPTPETRTTHVKTLSDLEAHISVLEGELGRASARFRKTTQPAGLPELEANLPKDAALVDFLIHGEDGVSKLTATVVTWNGGGPVYTLVNYPDLSAINAAVLKYRADIQNEDIQEEELQDTGQQVYDLVWKPVEAALGKSAKVYVVPDGMLNILPISAMVAKDGKYLIEKIDLYVLGSSRDLIPSAIPAAKGAYFIDAGPDYNNDSTAVQQQVDQAKRRSATWRVDPPATDAPAKDAPAKGAAPASEESGSRGAQGADQRGADQRGADERGVMGDLRGMASGMRGLHFDLLPGAEKEGMIIEATVAGGGKPATMLTKGDAQEQSLRGFEEPPEILHIATHGFFLKPDDTLRRRLLSLQRGSDVQLPPPGDNPLLRAGLAFAGINANAQVLGEIDTDNDGVLTALEVLSLNLAGTKLAILSACETGLGEIHEGEGVYGLRRAFQEAGVSSVVSSLWEVSDAGTQTLMSALYKRLLAGAPPHQALREAQLEMLRNPQWSQPYIWSAFFMVGG